MSDDESTHAQALITRLLQEGEQKANEGSYPTALIPIRKAKALDRTNVYILALERQVEQLKELSGAGILSEEQRSDILDSLPVLVENALRNATPLQSPGMPPGNRVETPQEDKGKGAAAQWLKNQYFQRAHAYVKDGEYDLALAEVQRVIVLDKQDRFAGEFELKIMQMLELRRRQPLVSRADPGTGGTPPSSRALLSGGPQTGEVPGAAGQTSSPAESANRKKTPVVIVAILITLVCVVLAIYFFSQRDQASKQYVPAVTEPAPEVEDDRYTPIPPPSVTDSSISADTTHSSLPADSLLDR
jgi:hypothetical protein